MAQVTYRLDHVRGQRRCVVDAVMAERRRCARLLENARARGAADLQALVDDVLERIRRPWRVREAARRAAVPGRLRKCCGLCGGDDHRAPTCPGRAT
jgi:hypothetical protein